MDKETKHMFELILNKLDGLDGLDGMEKRLDDIFSVVKAIEHSNNMRKTEIDNLMSKIDHIDDIINKIGDVIIENKSNK